MSEIKENILNNQVFFLLSTAIILTIFNVSEILSGVLLLGFISFIVYVIFILKKTEIDYFDAIERHFVAFRNKLLEIWQENKRTSNPEGRKYASHSNPNESNVGLDTVKTTETITEPTSASNNTTPNLEFQYKKRGGILNLLVLGSGMLVIFGIFTILVNLGLDLRVSSGVTGLFLILFIIDLIYFLPTLIYNASFGGKVVMFLANSLLGITLIGWIILLVIATSRNSKEKYKQELLHYVKQK